MADTADADEERRRERKRLKKLKRKQDQAEQASAEQAGQPAEEKKGKKSKAADADGAAAGTNAEPKKKKIKNKQEKVADEVDEEEPEEPAAPSHSELSRAKVSVGDHAGAANGIKFKKCFYKEHPEDVAANREKLEIAVESKAGLDMKPIFSFEHAGFSANIMKAVASFKAPSPIQAQCWPIVLSGHDLIGIAATGSGKTFAFILPALMHIAAQPKVGSGEPIVLVLAPTRELAMQSAEVAESAGQPCGVRSVCVYGGAPKGPQKGALRGGVEIVVATPGRLQDLMEEGALSLKRCTILVLDEADRMLDLGFEPAIRAIAGAVRSDRQTVMFSATWPESIQALAAEFLASPVFVRIGAVGTRAAHSITQIVEVIEDRARDERLEQLLAEYHGKKSSLRRCIIFVLYKKEATRVGEWLRRRGWNAHEIQGDMAQKQRTETVANFKEGTAPLLIATDVAARGLDIPGVECVLNYSFPLTIEDYVHRIGRTGRAGATGIAHTFFVGAHDKAHAGELVNVLREAKQAVPPELLKFGTHVKKKESKLYGAHFKDVDLSQKATKVVFGDDDD